MKKEFENIRNHFIEKNIDVPKHPILLSIEQRAKLSKMLMGRINKIRELDENSDIALCVKSILETIYCALEMCVLMDSVPNVELVCDIYSDRAVDGKFQYDEFGKIIPRFGWTGVYHDNISNHNKTSHSDIESDYEIIKSYHERFDLPVGNEKKVLSIEKVKNRTFSLYSLTEDFLNSIFIMWDNEYLSKIIFELLEMLVEMGVNPKEIYPIVEKYMMNGKKVDCYDEIKEALIEKTM